jgi:hypothetical protein
MRTGNSQVGAFIPIPSAVAAGLASLWQFRPLATAVLALVEHEVRTTWRKLPWPCTTDTICMYEATVGGASSTTRLYNSSQMREPKGMEAGLSGLRPTGRRASRRETLGYGLWKMCSQVGRGVSEHEDPIRFA